MRKGDFLPYGRGALRFADVGFGEFLGVDDMRFGVVAIFGGEGEG